MFIYHTFKTINGNDEVKSMEHLLYLQAVVGVRSKPDEYDLMMLKIYS